MSKAIEATQPRRTLDENLVKEYLYSVSAWDDFDRRTLTIKGWTAAGGLVAVSAVLNSQTFSSLVYVGLIVVIASLWFLDAQWRVFQHSNLERISALERHFAGESQVDTPFQSFNRSQIARDRGGMTPWLKEALNPLVFVPYFPLVILIVIAAFFHAPDSGPR